MPVPRYAIRIQVSSYPSEGTRKRFDSLRQNLLQTDDQTVWMHQTEVFLRRCQSVIVQFLIIINRFLCENIFENLESMEDATF